MRLKSLLLILLIVQTLLLVAQQKNYKISYRHCFMSDTNRILNDTIGIPAILIGNNKSSNYNFLKYSGASAVSSLNNAPIMSLEDAIKNKVEGKVRTKVGTSADSIGNIVFHNKASDSVFVRDKMPDKYLLTIEKTPTIDWQISNERKQIKNYTCQKATAYFRGRNYTAWFTKDLPIADGPWKFFDLPGLIMDIYDNRNQLKIYVEKIEYPTSEKVAAFIPSGDYIGLADYFTYKNKFFVKRLEAQNAMLQSQENLPEGVKPMATSSSVMYPIEKSLD